MRRLGRGHLGGGRPAGRRRSPACPAPRRVNSSPASPAAWTTPSMPAPWSARATLAGCTQAWPQTGMPARCAAAVSRRTAHAVELGVELEPHRARPARACATTDSGSSSRLNMDRRPAQPLHGHRRRLAVAPRPRLGLHRPEAVEEEAAAGHELHGVDPGRGLEARHPGEQRRRVGAHVAHRGDALGQQVAEVEAELLAGAAVRAGRADGRGCRSGRG